MKNAQGGVRAHTLSRTARAVAWLRRRRGLALCAILLVGVGATAAVLTPTVPPTFCTTSGCYPTLDKAEAAVRAAPGYAGVGSLVEHMQTVRFSATSVRQQYWLRDRPVETVRGLAYYAAYGLQGGSTGSCTLSDDQSAKPGWCADEGELVSLGLSRIQAAWASGGCTVTSTVITKDYDPPVLNGSPTTRGIVDYASRNYLSTGTCTNGTSKSQTWSISKQRPVYCRTGFGAIHSIAVSEATLTTANLCEAEQQAIAQITMPIQQCATCAGSRHPVYPATGEKQRAEPDFAFAGRTFTRYYRSHRQFRNNASFAVGWSHSYAERFLVATNDHIDEAGNYEGYTLIGGNRYRAANAADRIAEKVNAGGISWKLLMPDGEVREFDTGGYLIAIRNPNDPLNDVVIAYNADKAMSTVTDAQGRVLRFEYADNLLQRIVLPDGTGVAYGYDANLNLTAATYPGGATRQYHYNESGLAGDVDQRHHLTGITSEDGQRFASFGYDARGRVTSSRVLGTPNELTTVSYPTEDSAVIQTAEGDSRTYTIQPGIYRRILGAVDSAGAEQQTFDAFGRLETSTDKRGVLTRYEYASSGTYRSAVIEAVGTPEERREEITRDPTTHLPTERRTFDRLGALKAKTAWAYNAGNQVVATTATDPADNATRTTTTTYCTAADIAAANSTCPMPGLVKSVDGPRSDVLDIATYQYRSADGPACAASPATCPYRRGDLWKIVNEQQQVVEWLAYDGAGRVKSIKDANGVVTDFDYNARGWLLASKVRGTDNASETDDRIVRIDYWPTGAVQKTTQADGDHVMFGYDDAQRLTEVVDRDGNTISYTLNAAGEQVKEEIFDTSLTLRRTLARSYDSLGQLQSVRDHRAQTVAGAPATARYVDDSDGNLDTATDALGRVTDNDYDPLGRLTRTLQNATGVSSANDVAATSFKYDTLDRLTRVIDPNMLETEYKYNGFGDLTELVSKDTGTTTYGHDADGNRTTQTDANGKTTQYVYDALNRVVAINYPQEPSLNVAYAYDTAQSDCGAEDSFLVGRLGRMTDNSGSTSYCYDRFGRLTKKVQRTQGKTFALQWSYQPNGRLASMTHPNGIVEDYRYDAQGRVVQIGVTADSGRIQVLREASYAPFGPVQRWVFGNDLEFRRTLDKDYRPGVVEDGPEQGTGPGLSLGYAFDAVGNLATLRNGKQNDPPLRIYGYDGLDRLTRIENAAATVLGSYGYDKTGNRTASGQLYTSTSGDDPTGPGGSTTTTSWVGRTYSYVPNLHRLWTVGATERSYDSAGNTTRIGPLTAIVVDDPTPGDETGLESASYGGTAPTQSTGQNDGDDGAAGIQARTFDYSAANRMRSVSIDGVLAMSYRYNGKGERVYRSGSGDTVHSLYGEDGHWLGDYDVNGSAIQQVIWFDGLPVAVLAKIGNTLKLHYIEADALGTPRAVIDPVRNVAVWRWDLTDEAFGESEPSVDPDNDGHWFVFDMRYPGQQYDSVSGLNYNYFRDYDPSTGRYVQSDPIGLAGGISTYGYVYGNPNGYIDPLGLDGGGIYTNPNTRMAPPRAVNPRDLQDAGLALDIMMPLANEMKKRKIPNVDQFYHCLAACRAVHATGNKSMVIEVMNTKEATDWWRWRFGIYAKHFDSSSQMRADNASDQAVNEYGASCMPGENCVKRCRKYLDMIPAARRPEMADYVPEWTLKRSAK